VEKNLTNTFEYFREAMRQESDGDSLYNAGQGLEREPGTPTDYRPKTRSSKGPRRQSREGGQL
jgi:hypothetical protein